jgi:hypothetical protein
VGYPIYRTAVVVAAELEWGEEVMGVYVPHDSFGYNFFQELTTAF